MREAPAIALLGLVSLSVAAVRAADTIEAFGYKWQVPFAADWKVDSKSGLRLLVPREPLPGPRRPFQFAVAETPNFTRVKIEADARPAKRSLIIVFAYHDASHFDYAHFSIDTAMKQPVHNGVFHVYGGERVRISPARGPAAFAASERWYHITLEYNAGTGEVNCTVDGTAVPPLHAVDLSLGPGKVGLGSFNETGDFKNVKIDGEP